MATMKDPNVPLLKSDASKVTVKALELIDSLSSERSLQEIQEFLSTGKLDQLFPERIFPEPTPVLGQFCNIEEASGCQLTDEQFEQFLEQSR